MKPPVITQFNDYRELLKQLVAYKKFKRKTFSYRLLSKLTDVGSPNYFQLVIQGKRNLGEDIAHEVARVLGLNDDESVYFMALVRLSRAKDPQEIAETERFLQRTKAHLLSHRITEEQITSLSSWLQFTMRGLVNLANFEPSESWFEKNLYSHVDPEKFRTAIDSLITAGILKRDDEGKLSVPEEIIDTGIARFDMRGLCIETLTEWSKLLHNREIKDPALKYYLMNIPLPANKIAELQSKAEALLEEISGWYLDACQGQKEKLIQFGIFLVPTTRPESAPP